MGIWDSRAVLLHVSSVIHVFKQVRLDTSFAKAAMAVETAMLDIELTKGEYIQQIQNYEKSKGEGNKGREAETTPPVLTMAKVKYKGATKTLEAAKLTMTTVQAKAFKLYGNLLSGEARQPWEKIIKAQVTRAPWEYIYGETQIETPTKTWNSFCKCIMVHLLQCSIMMQVRPSSTT